MAREKMARPEYYSSDVRDTSHRENVKKKADRVESLSILLAWHESLDKPDWVYIEQLRERLRYAQNQFRYMKP